MSNLQPQDFTLPLDTTLLSYHDQLTDTAYDPSTLKFPSTLSQKITENHYHNQQLWHAEDTARRDDNGFEHVFQAKRRIDQHNQLRNNCVEAMDNFLFVQLKLSLQPPCPHHSETPGMMVDRLAILALKIHAMTLQTKRTDTDGNHLHFCQDKLALLIQQRLDLAEALTRTLTAIQNGQLTFKRYLQVKMYNDPLLNPQLQQQAAHQKT